MNKAEKIIPIITILLMVALVIFYLSKTDFSEKNFIKSFLSNNQENVQ